MVDQLIDNRQSSALSEITTNALNSMTSSSSTPTNESDNYNYFDPKLLQGFTIKE